MWHNRTNKITTDLFWFVRLERRHCNATARITLTLRVQYFNQIEWKKVGNWPIRREERVKSFIFTWSRAPNANNFLIRRLIYIRCIKSSFMWQTIFHSDTFVYYTIARSHKQCHMDYLCCWSLLYSISYVLLHL